METIRRRMAMVLAEGTFSAHDLSRMLRISEKEVLFHLPYIKRSTVSQGKKLVTEPARCLGCGFVFADRARMASPGRCPRCKGEHVEDPRHTIV